MLDSRSRRDFLKIAASGIRAELPEEFRDITIVKPL